MVGAKPGKVNTAAARSNRVATDRLVPSYIMAKVTRPAGLGEQGRAVDSGPAFPDVILKQENGRRNNIAEGKP